MFTPKEKTILREMATIYDEEGDLKKNEVKDMYAFSQESLDTFHGLIEQGAIEFTKNGRLYRFPNDDQFQ